MALTVDLETGRRAFVESVRGFVAAVDDLDEWSLLGSSRCHGWTRLDVVVHVVAGWQEMLGGFVSPVDGPPTVDAASYWPAFEEQEADEPLDALLGQRRRTTAYARPDSARAQMHDVADAVLRGAARAAPIGTSCGRATSSRPATSWRSGRSRTPSTSSTSSAAGRCRRARSAWPGRRWPSSTGEHWSAASTRRCDWPVGCAHGR